MAFVALDFETANRRPDSACAIGVVRAEDGRIVAREHLLIRPPDDWFEFSDLHGIFPADVETAPRFPEAWESVLPLFDGAEFVAAHNAPFDRNVLAASCDHYGLPNPGFPFVCTVQLARRRFGIFPTKLPLVCERLGIDLDHHNALSDAEACARIVLAANAFSTGDGTRLPMQAPAARP